ncbi:hypothetical protein BV898_15727 [Hypsibius exemplaris]|uniref:Uncharacterized protein n=1 Tax=Hypsibius exemplaris TaxID=2072580 RepID=A0A9X6NEK0_HYPEX|nr:hypothetical protein BV898_15727 [Hypsibius exemplaris]
MQFSGSPFLCFILTIAIVPTLTTASICRWEGTAPFCSPVCSDGWYRADSSRCGDGACCWTGVKYKCCTID